MANFPHDGRTEPASGGVPPTDPRVRLAVERTLLAWVRTGLAMMGFGFVVARFGLFLRELAATAAHTAPRTSGLSLWIGTGLVVSGVLVNVLAAAQHLRDTARLRRGSRWYVAWPVRRTRTSVCSRAVAPTGITSLPPIASCSRSVAGTSGPPAATTIASYGACSGQPRVPSP